MMDQEDRLGALRRALAQMRLDGFLVPVADEHLSELSEAHAQRLAWLTGFTGSAGMAVVLAAEAAIFVDGRYTEQLNQQVKNGVWNRPHSSESSVAEWLKTRVTRGSRIGYDPWLHSRNETESLRRMLREQAVDLVAVDVNPIDDIWADRPALPTTKLVIHVDRYAGQSSTDKRRALAKWLMKSHLDAVILTARDSIAWTFNVRCRNVKYTPVTRAFAIVLSDESARVFTDLCKITDEVIAHLGDPVEVRPYSEFMEHLGALTGKRIAVDPARSVQAIFQRLANAGATIVETRDPVVLAKAIKNDVEIAGHRAAQLRDGVAMSRFLHWLSTEAPKGNLTELSANAQLTQFRQDTGELQSLAWPPISCAGAHGALPHYNPTDDTDMRIEPNSLYLNDSGAQYLDGTTDVCRTIAVGTPNLEMRDRFTRVLKGHIALARAVFPAGTCGIQLDAFARQFLWTVGLDYSHGTGHGVGAYLGIHEGPQRITHTADAAEPLSAGMILSNEPGYYKSGEYGIRIENLMHVATREVSGAEREMLGFEVLTQAPIDRHLIDVTLLTEDERDWLNAYHARVSMAIGPLLDKPAQQWLHEVTAAI